ncbi:conserved unknown protein [Ectocarpus siliculosus]|uniref:Uncharacterized protein n=1 Tax=Ectocarpus siliculosus TaxID=2880 RepID=D7G3H6_ECTSI|nr:conserved unknown protein [Ectocarpus siliculosus]|eukprot:CBJ26974.1 conserved unknown protein [Ectocarpus siliculosus]
MVVGAGEQQGGGEETGAFGPPEYEIPAQPGAELVRLDMAEVPVDRAQRFVWNWAKRRVGPEVDPGWKGTVRLAQARPKYGVPPTDMPVSDSRTNLGATLSFDGSPSDVINIEVFYLRRGGSCVMVTRGLDGLARLGGMGPQIASLVRHSEDVIKDKLQDDLASFPDDYHDRVLKGLAPAAEPYDEEGGEDDEGDDGGKQQQQQPQATVLPDGVIDVTPTEPPPAARKKKKPPAPWMDGSAPPPMERMEDSPERVDFPPWAPAEQQEDEVPSMDTLFDEVDKPKLDAQVFELFKTMEKGEKGEETVIGAEAKGGADSFFADMRADNGTTEAELVTLFEAGKNASRRGGVDESSREERDAMIAANQAAVNTVQQLAKMHQKLEMQQLEKIRDICEAALEDMDTLPDKIRYMKPLLDDKFVAYMGYAIQTEREAVDKRGLNPDREPSRWLQVLGVIQKGVMAELQKSVHQDVELISHVLRMKEPEERLALLNITISTLPSMYIRGFKRTATNIVDYYEAMGDNCMDQDLRSMVLEIGENLKVLMSEERMAVLTKEIDDWAAKKAEEDSTELRRLREYEAEDLELRRATASGLWNKQMHPDATMDTEEKAEIRKLTDALKGQNLLRSGKIQNALAARGLGQTGDGFDNNDVIDSDSDDDFVSGGFGMSEGGMELDSDYDDLDDLDDLDDGGYTDEADLRRKLNRLAGPGGAMEAESREAPHLFSSGGPLESPEMARALGGPAGGSGDSGGGSLSGGAFGSGVPQLSELEKEVAADVGEMSDAFSDVRAYSSDSMPRPPSVLATEEEEEEEEEESDTGDEWGSFDDDDWLGKSSKEGTGGSGGGEEEEEEEALLRPRGAGMGESVPGLLGGARFGKNLAAGPDDGEGEEGIVDEVRDEAKRSAGRRR